MPINMEGLIVALLGIGAGTYWFFTGFRELKASRTIQDIPTSRISTGAVGTNVEIKGQIQSATDALFKSPISGQSCAFYSLEIQKLVQSRNRTYWKRIDQFYSSDQFFIDDGSGALAEVFVDGANIRRQGKEHDFKIKSNEFFSMPVSLKTTLEKHAKKLRVFKLQETSWLFSNQYRFVEWCFKPEESVYVLGYAESGVKAPTRQKLKFKDFLAAKKSIEEDPKLQARFDRNQDGVLDAGEMEQGAEMVGLQLKTQSAVVEENPADLKIRMAFKKRSGIPFLISNMKEKDLVKKISLMAGLKLWGGPGVAIAGTVYLVFMLGFKV